MSAANPFPRRRGFNLLEMFTHRNRGDFREDDFRWIADWGFDFVRLPLCYRLWVKDDDPARIDEPALERVDRAVELGRKYGIHVMLNFHRAPGYCVNPGLPEPYDLWRDAEALAAFCSHWEVFARRYRGIPAEKLSFNLVNEPPALGERLNREDHARVIGAAAAAIRGIDPERIIVADGTGYGNQPSPELADCNLVQSCRGYLPMGLSHYGAEWVECGGWPVPVWPGAGHYGEIWDKERLTAHYDAWAQLIGAGQGVFCGEAGAYNRTPHRVFLAWLRDVLEILTARGIGYALWNFRGPFGVLDSGRSDVDYADWHGHKLDRELLELLREF